jgi:hypothetical protein
MSTVGELFDGRLWNGLSIRRLPEDPATERTTIEVTIGGRDRERDCGR